MSVSVCVCIWEWEWERVHPSQLRMRFSSVSAARDFLLHAVKPTFQNVTAYITNGCISWDMLQFLAGCASPCWTFSTSWLIGDCFEKQRVALARTRLIFSSPTEVLPCNCVKLFRSDTKLENIIIFEDAQPWSDLLSVRSEASKRWTTRIGPPH